MSYSNEVNCLLWSCVVTFLSWIELLANLPSAKCEEHSGASPTHNEISARLLGN